MKGSSSLDWFLGRWRIRPNLLVSLVFLLLAMVCLPILDTEIQGADPWHELSRFGLGFLTPSWEDWPLLVSALTATLAFSFSAVFIAVVVGGLLSLCYRFRAIRVFCAAIRSVHEIFWGLIFMQVFGLSATTGVLAIAVPFSGIFARVFADIYDEQPRLPGHTIAGSAKSLSGWLYIVLPQSFASLSAYVRYRFECALRSSAILGFIGLPTLGFYFESAFKQGDYSEAALLLWVFYLLIASLRWWLHWRLLPFYCLAAFILLPDSPPVSSGFLWQFVSREIWPQSLLHGDIQTALSWYASQVTAVVLPATLYTLVLSMVAVVLTGIMVIFIFPFATRVCVGPAAVLGHGILIFLRSTPELVLAFIFLFLFGPSAIPAILALAIHNSGLIAYLLARDADKLSLRPDSAKHANLWAYEMVPRLYPRFCALLLYRWEVIIRESAILGMLGVTTLGFYVDSAFAEIRFDKAFLLILATALLNIIVDSVSHRINRFIRSPSRQLVPPLHV